MNEAFGRRPKAKKIEVYKNMSIEQEKDGTFSFVNKRGERHMGAKSLKDVKDTIDRLKRGISSPPGGNYKDADDFRDADDFDDM